MNKSYFTRKEQIILSAVEIINELGIDGLSIRELAKKENVTEGAIYRHYKSKDDIIIEVLNYFSHFDINIIKTIEKNKLDSKSAIIFFINSLMEYYENYPEITSVFCAYESLLYVPNIRKNAVEIIDRRFYFIKNIIDRGKDTGEILPYIISDNLADLILGTCRHMIFKWRYEEYKFSLKKRTLELIGYILKSALSS